MKKSCCKTESADRGQKIVTSYPRDNSSHSVPKTKGDSWGGSVTNLAHSLPGTSAKQEHSGGNKKNRFS
jgi:hypothetical protein